MNSAHPNHPKQQRFGHWMNISVTTILVVLLCVSFIYWLHHDDPRYNPVRYLNGEECHVVSPKGVEPCSVYTDAALREMPIIWGDPKNAFSELEGSHL